MYIGLTLRAGDRDAGNASETMYWFDVDEPVQKIIDRVSVMVADFPFKVERLWKKSYHENLPPDVKVKMLSTVVVTTPTPDPDRKIWSAVLTAATGLDIGRWHKPRWAV